MENTLPCKYHIKLNVDKTHHKSDRVNQPLEQGCSILRQIEKQFIIEKPYFWFVSFWIRKFEKLIYILFWSFRNLDGTDGYFIHKHDIGPEGNDFFSGSPVRVI